MDVCWALVAGARLAMESLEMRARDVSRTPPTTGAAIFYEGKGWGGLTWRMDHGSRLELTKFEVLLKITGRGVSSRGAQSGSGARAWVAWAGGSQGASSPTTKAGTEEWC